VEGVVVEAEDRELELGLLDLDDRGDLTILVGFFVDLDPASTEGALG
jgi:hypothetical protein